MGVEDLTVVGSWLYAVLSFITVELTPYTLPTPPPHLQASQYCLPPVSPLSSPAKSAAFAYLVFAAHTLCAPDFGGLCPLQQNVQVDGWTLWRCVVMT